MPGRLQDKVVLVTGSAGGIDSALVYGMLAEGASVMAVDLSEALLAAQMATLARSGHGGRLLPFETDVSDARACASCIEECVSAFARIDALVNNAALGMGVVRADHMTNLVGIEELAPEVRRFVAARWDEALPPAQAAERCAAPIAWPELAQQPVSPDDRRPAS